MKNEGLCIDDRGSIKPRFLTVMAPRIPFPDAFKLKPFL